MIPWPFLFCQKPIVSAPVFAGTRQTFAVTDELPVSSASLSIASTQLWITVVGLPKANARGAVNVESGVTDPSLRIGFQLTVALFVPLPGFDANVHVYG